jgi:hypothetical protein
MNQEIVHLFKAAVECSIFLNPVEPGLTYGELREIGQRAGYQAGEINDALRYAGEVSAPGKDRIIPDQHERASFVFYMEEEPDFRNLKAFDFAISQLNERVKVDGMQNAQLARAVLVERAVRADIPRNDIEAAITCLIMSNTLTERHEVLRFDGFQGVHPLPSDQFQRRSPPIRKPHRARAYQLVQDVIQRRTDGRPKQAEPLDDFAVQLEKLSFGPFRLWWTHTVGELRRTDPTSSSVSACVLAAALIEGALTFLVKHARGLDLGVFRSSDFDGEPRTWKIEHLIKSAASGGNYAILSSQLKNRAEVLCQTRQRIHAGRMLSDYPKGLPDLRPEEARDAKATAEQVVRAVLDWLQRFPPS